MTLLTVKTSTLTHSFNHACPARRGGALVLSLVVTLSLMGIAVSAITLSLAESREVNSATRQMQSLYLAEAGVAASMVEISGSLETGTVLPTNLGTIEAPVELASGKYRTTLTDNADGTYRIASTGTAGLASQSIEVVVQRRASQIFNHAIYAGNKTDDPDYSLELGGVGAQGDNIGGDIYSGGDIDVIEDATVGGNAAAYGTITGVSGLENVRRSPPDIAAMDYANNNDFDVASLFGTATWESDELGGSAWQLPEDSPAHIFRKNPDDRTEEVNGTTKDDYFLEDPHEPVTDFEVGYNGTDGHSISLSGTMGDPGVSGTDKVYYIDGNLWVHNKTLLTLRINNTDAEGVKVTFVVRGNVYFSDDVLVGDATQDGLAFIAIEDEAVPDSGNVYLGDPRYGTIERMEAFLYAENDFRDQNLDEVGSATLTLFGNMTAGNHVEIERDYIDSNGDKEHSKLTVDYDDRIRTGALALPGLPRFEEGVNGLAIVFWRKLPRE